MKRIILLVITSWLLVSCDRKERTIFNDMARHKSVFVKRFQALKYNGKTYGSGFNIKYKGKYFVITNRHVCDVSERLGTPNVAIVNGKVLKILKVFKKHDLCALESDKKDGFYLAKQDVTPMDKIILIGHPRGLDLTIREGRIIAEDVKTCVGGYVPEGVLCRLSDQISALAYGGNSGSPVLNRWGRVIGVLYAGSNRYPNEPFIVPYEFLKEFLDTLVKE